MQNRTSIREFLTLSEDRPDLPGGEREIYRRQVAILQFSPILLSFNALGYLVLFSISSFESLGTPEVGLIWLAGLFLLASALFITVYPYAKEARFNTVSVFYILINAGLVISQTFFWGGLLWLLIPLAFIPAIETLTQKATPLWTKVFSVLSTATVIFTLFFIEGSITLQRIQTESLSSVAAVFIYILINLMMVLLINISSNRTFKTIGARLIITFGSITLLAALTTILIGGLSNYYRDQSLNFERLRTIAALRESQVTTLLQSISRDASAATQDSIIRERAKYLLQGDRSSLIYRLNQQLVEDYFRNLLARASQYDELLLIDASGKVLISTDFDNRQISLANYSFFKNAFRGNYITVEQNFPEANGPSIILVSPIIEGQIFPGIVALRVGLENLGEISQSQSDIGIGFDSYLIGPDGNTLTDTLEGPQVISGDPFIKTFIEENISGQGTYFNYAGQLVLGYYKYIPGLNATIISEVQQSRIVNDILNLLATYGAVGIFTTLIAIVLVYITSRSIGTPIVQLAEKATLLAGGDLSTRIQIEREDEIGTLATTINTVADELQGLIRNLEFRVNERTEDLQKQANRLRLASEVSRDAASAQDLGELLNRTAQLLLERFNYYHTGIFLIDNSGTLAVLRASTTEAGKKMLARNHSLKVGEVGIVGVAASTGQPRIATSTGEDRSHFNNPLLPLTRSEMAIPLKVEGQVIGVLDVQSEEENAFKQEDISIVQVVADQLAQAIQRVELLENLQNNVSELQRTYQTFTSESWDIFSQSNINTLGFKFDGNRLSEVTSFPAEIQSILQNGQIATLSTEEDLLSGHTSLAVPVKLRDVVLGVISLKIASPVVSSETLSIIEGIADRLATAIENNRLLLESRQRAERERAISEVASQISTATDTEAVLRTALVELGKRLGEREISIRLTKKDSNS